MKKDYCKELEKYLIKDLCIIIHELTINRIEEGDKARLVLDNCDENLWTELFEMLMESGIKIIELIEE